MRDDILVSRKGCNLLLSGTVKPEKKSGVNGYYELTMRPAYRWLDSSVGRELPQYCTWSWVRIPFRAECFEFFLNNVKYDLGKLYSV